MIQVTRLNGKKFWVNPHLIEFLEETPDTVVTLLTGKKLWSGEKASGNFGGDHSLPPPVDGRRE